MKRFIMFVIVAFMLIGMVSCDSQASDENITSSWVETQPSSEEAETTNIDASNISVRFETDYIDGDRLHITVFTKNNSDEVFAGNVYVTFYSFDGKDRLGSDTIIVDDLLPGSESWADVIVDVYIGTPQMAVDFSEVRFSPLEKVSAEFDAEATERIKNSYYWGFDGVSWYNDITDIVAYKNGTCVVVITDNSKEDGKFYAATIWSCGNDYGVNTVQVVNMAGTIVAVYGDGKMISVTVNNGVIITNGNSAETERNDTPSPVCDHTWNNGETTKAATCTETGTKTYTCTKCFEQKRENISVVDHTYDSGSVSKKPTCTDVGKITYTCSVCKAQYSEDIEKTAHKWDDGKVINAATCTLEGTKEYHCTTCGATKTESIPLTAHNYTEKIVSDKYRLSDATYTSGSVYYCSCVCGAVGNNTFTADDRIEWVSVSQLEFGGFNCSFALPLPYDDPQYYWLKNWNTETVYKIYGVPSETLVNGKVYTCNCNGYSIRMKSEKTEHFITYLDYFFFNYDDLVAAGIIG